MKGKFFAAFALFALLIVSGCISNEGTLLVNVFDVTEADDVESKPPFLPGATVEVYSNSGLAAIAKTDNNGKVSFELAVGDYDVVASKDGYGKEKQETTVSANQTTNLEFLLEKAGGGGGGGDSNVVSGGGSEGLVSPAFEIAYHRVWLNFDDGQGKIISAAPVSGFDSCFDILMSTGTEAVCAEGKTYNQGEKCRYYLQETANNPNIDEDRCVLEISFEEGSSGKQGKRFFESDGNSSSIHRESIREISDSR
ncbi:MAG: hypothetical protein QT03_C0001G0310 [archaeon GW2011_AR10]|uniref:Carboxypeptidase regulatory-like domain-containing protein n=1 Tax=Candidatus Iainarchaeum sp. TaxID=3101447 RepID=A0A7J4IVV3_9ARCH|nr:MAG: hypothetical protein QT03_C0001G0310 [archaeon GW2011_AR10]HIH08904.1 carboxypeptidase regulatory-like domain-containing protein [Candidatus Diapherotrites archaeon]